MRLCTRLVLAASVAALPAAAQQEQSALDQLSGSLWPRGGAADSDAGGQTGAGLIDGTLRFDFGPGFTIQGEGQGSAFGGSDGKGGRLQLWWANDSLGLAGVFTEAAEPTIRVVVGADDEVLVGQLATSSVAVTGSDVETLESVQFKGRVTRIEEPTEHDLAAFAEGCRVFLQKVRRTDGNQIHKMRKIVAQRVIVIEVEVTQLFDQTPGPAAGRLLTADGNQPA